MLQSNAQCLWEITATQLRTDGLSSDLARVAGDISMDDLQELIRKRAYEIWERHGRTGDSETHWLEAERELTGATTTAPDLDKISVSPPARLHPRRARLRAFRADQIATCSVPAMAARPDQCHWPLWGANSQTGLVCGDAARPGRSYCDEHCKVAYVTPSSSQQRHLQRFRA